MGAMRGTHSTFEIDELLHRIARRQLGLISVDQASQRGIDRSALSRRQQAGLLVPVHTGVMRLAAVPPSAMQGILAASLAVPGSTIAGVSAAVVHQMPLPQRFLHPDASKLLSIPTDRKVTQRGIVTTRQSSTQRQSWMTTHVATPASTLLLLPRFVDAAIVERCLDHCLAHRLVSVETLRSTLESVAPSSIRNRRLLVALLDARSVGIGHRSGKEQTIGRWLDDAGLGGWKRNHRVSVGGGKVVEVDFAWDGDRLALEVSPFFTHGSRRTQERDAERRRLLVEHRWRVVEATDRDLVDRASFRRTVIALRRLLAEDSEDL